MCSFFKRRGGSVVCHLTIYLPRWPTDEPVYGTLKVHLASTSIYTYTILLSL